MVDITELKLGEDAYGEKEDIVRRGTILLESKAIFSAEKLFKMCVMTSMNLGDPMVLLVKSS